MLLFELTCPLCCFSSFVGLNPSWDADSCSYNQELPHIVRNPRFTTVHPRYLHRHIFRCTLFHSTLPFYFLRSSLILSPRLCLGLASGLSLSRLLFKPKHWIHFLLAMRVICVASLIVIYLIEWHVLAEYKLYISSLDTSRQPSLTYSTLPPNILLNTVFCNTRISLSSLNIRVQVLYLHDRQIYTS